MTSMRTPRVLLSEPAMASLRDAIAKENRDAAPVLERTVSAIRSSLESGLRAVFIIGAVAMLLAFLIILTIPEISIDAKAEETKAP